MAKINKEEYEILKGLDSKWKWIARDEMGVLDCYIKKPKKYKLILKFWSDSISPPKFIDGSNFQFIQWKDEEPYNIQELIEEYESEYHIENAKIVNIDTSKITPWTPNPLDFESEETELKKDKKWLVDKWTEERNGTDVHDPMYHLMNEFIADVNQLDEPEVLSEEWIEENSALGQFATSNVINFDKFVKADKLKNLLVPKQEKVKVPQVVADWIETEKRRNNSLGYSLYKLEGFGDVDNENVDCWVKAEGSTEKLARAWLDGYTVEEEQKYVVELPNPNNQMGRHKNVFLNKKDGKVFIDSADLFVNDITMYGQFALTEEEIKKDFEWAWEFAKPVEEPAQ